MVKPRNLFEMKIQARAFGVSATIDASKDDCGNWGGKTVVRGYHIA